MSQPERLSIKLFTREPAATERVVEMFHGWIRDQKVGGLLIDIHDYSHVANGPGVMLIGHEGQYRYENGDEHGLRYAAKRELEGDLSQRVRTVVAEALKAARFVEEETGVSFVTDRVVLRVEDRLAAPNRAGTFAALESELRAAVEPIFGADAQLEAGPVDKSPFAVVIRPQFAPDQLGSDQSGSDQSGSDQSGSDQSGSDLSAFAARV